MSCGQELPAAAGAPETEKAEAAVGPAAQVAASPVGQQLGQGLEVADVARRVL